MSEHPLDLRRVRHLAAAVAAGSLSAAAQRLGLSQPALSNSLKSLEADLGLALLERHPHGVRATAAATALLEHAHNVEQELASAMKRLTHLKRQRSGSLRIGCGPSEATRLLPLALLRLLQQQPELQVVVEYGLNEALMPMVRRGEVDCALSSVPRSAAHPELQHTTVQVDEAVIVARADHPLAERRQVAVKDLARYPWVLARRWELERKALDDLFAQAGLPPVEAAVETSSAVLMKSLVQHSDFLTFVPHEMVRWETQAQLLRPLRPLASAWARHVGLTTRKGREAPATVQALLACLQAVAQAGPNAAQNVADNVAHNVAQKVAQNVAHNVTHKVAQTP